jgi:hypothetical protein
MSGSHFNKPEYKGCGNAASGTLYSKRGDALLIDNAGIETDKATIVSASVRNTKLYPG